MFGFFAPIAILAGALLYPHSRAFIAAFFAPLPPSSGRYARDAGPMMLPSVSVLGAESVELRTLREDSAAEGGGFVRKPRAALFTLGDDGAIPSAGTSPSRPVGRKRPDLMQRDDENVDRAVEWLVSETQTREAFVEAWKRSGRFSMDLARILGAWKVPESALAVILVESAAQPTDTSEDGGMGMWKLTPDVAHVYGLSMLPTYDERRGVASSSEAAAHYLSDLRERFGSWELALVAFGFGYKRTLDELARHGSTDYWEVSRSLPRDCTTYVAEVLATAIVLANSEKFGFGTVKRDEPPSLSSFEIPGGSSLLLVARAAGLPPSALRDLNPEYGDDVVPRTSFPLLVHVPSERLARTRHFLSFPQEGLWIDDAGLAADAPPSPPSPRVISQGVQKRMFYRVKEGDTLPSLAARHEVPVGTIASDNALDPTASLRPGMILAIRVEEPSSDAKDPPLPNDRSSRTTSPPPTTPKPKTSNEKFGR